MEIAVVGNVEVWRDVRVKGEWGMSEYGGGWQDVKLPMVRRGMECRDGSCTCL